MASRSHIASLCTAVLALLDTTQQRLTAEIIAHVAYQPFGASGLDLLQLLRVSISELANDDCDAASSLQTGFRGLPLSIQRETIVILDSCEQTLIAFCHELEDTTLTSASLNFLSRESDPLHKLNRINDRLKIVLDLRSLSSTDLLGEDPIAESRNNIKAPTSSKAEMLDAIAQMRGLFVSETPASGGPPTYDEAIQDCETPSLGEKLRSGSPRDKSNESQVGNADSMSTSEIERVSKNKGKRFFDRPRCGKLQAVKLTTIQGRVDSGCPVNHDGPCRYFRGKEGGRLALTTTEAVQLYEADTGTLLWELEGSSQQLIEWNGQPVSFTPYFQFSPDGSILCVEVTVKWGHRELLILNGQDGRVIRRTALAESDGTVLHVSPDNTKVALFSWPRGHEPMSIKVILFDGKSNKEDSTTAENLTHRESGLSMIPISRVLRGGGISMSFAPDSKHIITSEGKSSNRAFGSDDESFPTLIRVYRSLISGGILVHEHCIAGSRAPMNTFFEGWATFSMRFHYPSPDIWLVSFSDFTDNMCKTRIVEAMTGETVALVSAEKTTWQSWKSGVLHPHAVDMAYDESSGSWTRMELTKTMLPPGQTATITRFELPKPARQPDSVQAIKDAWSVARSQVVIANIGADDICDLSRDGTRLFVRRAPQQVHVWLID